MLPWSKFFPPRSLRRQRETPRRYWQKRNYKKKKKERKREKEVGYFIFDPPLKSFKETLTLVKGEHHHWWIYDVAVSLSLSLPPRKESSPTINLLELSFKAYHIGCWPSGSSFIGDDIRCGESGFISNFLAAVLYHRYPYWSWIQTQRTFYSINQ